MSSRQASEGKSPQSMLEGIQKQLLSKNQKLTQVFFQFDKDQDTFLNQTEFTSFLKTYYPGINPNETKAIIDYLNPFKIDCPLISLYQLVLVIRDDPSLVNMNKAPPIGEYFKNYNPQQSQAQQNQLQQDQPGVSALASQLDHQYYVISHPNVEGTKEFVTIFEKLVATKSSFEDKEFPANNQSLGQKELERLKKSKHPISWKRPKDFPKIKNEDEKNKEWSLFVSDGNILISPEDIRQGELGDCYYLSSISSIANKYPQSIDDLFITKKTNEFGIYAVYICIDGFWRVIWVDDIFPCKDTGPIYSSSLDKELWVMVLEKAWAKIFGSYSNIIAGNPREVLKALTGGITWECKTKDPKFEQKFKEGYDRKCVMVAGSKTEKEMPDVQKYGFVPGHAYTILKIYDDPELQKIKQGVKLVKIRNPWGEKEWNGDWSDSSNLWTEELKQKYKLVNRNDGVFYMALTDFEKFFPTVQFLYFRDHFKHHTIKIKPKKKHALYYQIDIQKKGEYFFTAIQQDKRFHKASEDNYCYSQVKMALIQAETYDLYEIQSDASEEVWIGTELKNRTYYLYLKVDWEDGKEREMGLCVYGENQVANMKEIPKIPNLFHNLFRTKCKNSQNWKPYKQAGIQKCTEFDQEKGFGYLAIDNQSQQTIETTIQFKNMSGLKFKKPERGNQFQLKVAPGETRIAVAKVSSGGFSFQLSESYKTY